MATYGGDALLVGVRLQGRGAQVVAVLVGDSAYERGLRTFITSGGRVADAQDPSGAANAISLLVKADLVARGIVDISGRPGLSAQPGVLQPDKIDYLICDEACFYTVEQIEQLADLVNSHEVDV